MKYILVIGDGMADNPIESLGGKTPLEAAQKENIDRLAKKGMVGSTLTVPEGMQPGSDTAILSVFGYNPTVYYSGRSPLEAAGSGLELKAGNISYRCNLVAIDGDGSVPLQNRKMLSHSAGSVGPESAITLMNALLSDPEFKSAADALGLSFQINPSFRHLTLQQSADNRGFRATPPHDIVGREIGQYLPEGCENAQKLKELMVISNKILENHPVNIKKRQNGRLPANIIWFWAEGEAIELPSFFGKYGKKGSVVSAVPLVWGIASLAGLKPVNVAGSTGTIETNYEGKVDALIAALKDGDDFAAIHIEAPDECSHDGSLEQKLEAISRLDKRVVGPIAERMGKENLPFRMLLLSDHKTLLSTRTHDGDPVPYLIYDSRIDSGDNLPYTEQAGEGRNYVGDAADLMRILFSK